MPTPSIRASTYGGYFSSGTITLPTHQSGDLLLVFIVSSKNVTSISGTGWAFWNPSNAYTGHTKGNHTLLYKTATSASETAPSLTYDGTPTTDWIALSILDADVATRAWGLFDVNHEYAASTTSFQQSNINCRYDNALLLHLCANLDGAFSGETANSWTHVGTESSATAMYSKTVSAQGAVTAPSFTAVSGLPIEGFTFHVLGSNAGTPGSIGYGKPNAVAHDTSGNSLTLHLYDLICSHPTYDYHLLAVGGLTSIAQSSTSPFLNTRGLDGWEHTGDMTDPGYITVWMKPCTQVPTTRTATLSWQMSSAVDTQIMLSIRGLNSSRPIATLGWEPNSGLASSTRTITELLTTHANQEHLLLFSDINYGVDITWPSGYTEIVQAKETAAGATIGMARKTYADAGSTTGPITLTTSANVFGKTFGLLLLGANDAASMCRPYLHLRGDFTEVSAAGTTSLYRVDLAAGDFIVLFGFCADTALEVSQTITTPAETNVLKLAEYDAANAWNNHTRLIEVTSDFSGTLVLTTANDPGADINASMIVVRGVPSASLFDFFETVDNTGSLGVSGITATPAKDFPAGSVGTIHLIIQRSVIPTANMDLGNWRKYQPSGGSSFDTTSPANSYWVQFYNFNAQPETDWNDITFTAAADKAMLQGFLVQGALGASGLFMGND